MLHWTVIPALFLWFAADSPLTRAALNGDAVEVRTLLSRGADPNVRDGDGRTPLMLVAALHHTVVPDDRRNLPRDPKSCAQLLLDHHAAIDARDPAGQTALLIALEGSASEYGITGADEPLVRLLVTRGAGINVQDAQGWSPLLKALNLWADQPALLDFLLARGADVTARLKDGRSSLMLAARIGKDERFPQLIAKGADVNARSATGQTALMIAATLQWDEQSSAMMKLLAAARANLSAVDNQGRTAADLAARAGYLDRAKFLLDAGATVADTVAFWKRARSYALLHAVSDGAVETVATLLTGGADPNFRDDDGTTPSKLAAAQEYSAEKALLLLNHGADPNLAAANGDTPLMIAAGNYQAEIARALLDHGADAKAVDREGNTVLMRAAASKRSWQEDRKPLILALLGKGANPATANHRGVTALMLLALNGNPALPLLLEKPIDVNARDVDGNTALHYAARFFVRDAQRRDGWALLEKGADVNAANQKGETPLILAATQSEPDAAQLLLQKGANVNARTREGRTALMQAIDAPKEFDNDRHIVYSPAIAKLLIAAGADLTARDQSGATAKSLAASRGYTDILPPN